MTSWPIMARVMVRLIIGDSDASSTFAGIIQNSDVPITKIGTNTITLSGPNTYNGDTVVKTWPAGDHDGIDWKRQLQC